MSLSTAGETSAAVSLRSMRGCGPTRLRRLKPRRSRSADRSGLGPRKADLVRDGARVGVSVGVALVSGLRLGFGLRWGLGGLEWEVGAGAGGPAYHEIGLSIAMTALTSVLPRSSVQSSRLPRARSGRMRCAIGREVPRASPRLGALSRMPRRDVLERVVQGPERLRALTPVRAFEDPASMVERFANSRSSAVLLGARTCC